LLAPARQSHSAVLTMRALVYAAGVYALCIGCSEAFAPKSAVGSLPTAKPVMGKRTQSIAMCADDPTDVMVRVDEMMQGKSMQQVASSMENSFNSAASQTWKPPAGYNPRARSRPVNTEDSATIMARAHHLSGSAASVAAPRKKFEPYGGGYTPKGSAASSEDTTAVMARVSEMLGGAQTSAPAKKWTSPTGYVPGSQSSAPAKKWQVCTI
jgi:hypothetical protein